MLCNCQRIKPLFMIFMFQVFRPHWILVAAYIVCCGFIASYNGLFHNNDVTLRKNDNACYKTRNRTFTFKAADCINTKYMQCNKTNKLNEIYLLCHSDEWWRGIWPLPSVYLCMPERVRYHQPCLLHLYMHFRSHVYWGDEIHAMPTSRITVMLIHKVLDCIQVAIGTGQQEWGVTSLVDWLCM